MLVYSKEFGEVPPAFEVSSILVDNSGVLTAGLEGKIVKTASPSGHPAYTARTPPMTAIDTALENPGVGVNALAWHPVVKASLRPGASTAPPADPNAAGFYAAYTNGDSFIQNRWQVYIRWLA